LPIPLVSLLVWVANPDHAAAALTMGWIAVLALCVSVAPLAGVGRGEACALAALATSATVVAGVGWLYVAFTSLCTRSGAEGLLAVAAGVLLYLGAGAAALRSDEPVSRLAGLPLAIVAGFVLSLLAMAILTGGPHWCET
jgi:hypothetical protein